ncbi:hypothetical protein HNY73_012963 [Argiope bruennichi]|uniref:Uncharacterized protein n=1 Tax=Argiope bruennichi TaxID=94029 RepID=A0A8T0EWK9_ARGBR|nr:hypothetical protein HNY73_012963 [Argiope bruennichi]
MLNIYYPETCWQGCYPIIDYLFTFKITCKKNYELVTASSIEFPNSLSIIEGAKFQRNSRVLKSPISQLDGRTLCIEALLYAWILEIVLAQYFAYYHGTTGGLDNKNSSWTVYGLNRSCETLNRANF